MIYFCIPAHNEERTVGVLLWKIRQVMASFPRDYQILVANDGSTDGTAEVLSPYQRVLPLTVVQIEQRHGYASALELLIREASRRSEYPRRDVIVTLQADFTEDPDGLLDLLKRVEAGADIVVANAVLPATTPRSLRWPRLLGNRLLKGRNWPEGVTDPLGGLRAYRVAVVRKALETRGAERLLTWDGWAANAELLDLTQPHSRRTEAINTQFRGDRQQRPSRHSLWPLLGSVIRYARGGTGPLAGTPLPTPSTVDLRDRRRPPERRPSEPAARESGRGERPRSTRRNGREQERPARPVDERRRTERKARPARAERTAEESNGARPPRQRTARPGPRPPAPVAAEGVEGVEAQAQDAETRAKKRRRRRRGRGGRTIDAASTSETQQPQEAGLPADPVEAAEGTNHEPTSPEADGPDGAAAPRKRRSRRGGRGRKRRGRAREGMNGSTTEGQDGAEAQTEAFPVVAEVMPPPSPVDAENT